MYVAKLSKKFAYFMFSKWTSLLVVVNTYIKFNLSYDKVAIQRS